MRLNLGDLNKQNDKCTGGNNDFLIWIHIDFTKLGLLFNQFSVQGPYCMYCMYHTNVTNKGSSIVPSFSLLSGWFLFYVCQESMFVILNCYTQLFSLLIGWDLRLRR